MSYYNRLHPWCLVRCLPNAQTLIVARFRRREDACAYLRILRQLISAGIFEIVFDGEVKRSEIAACGSKR